MVWLYRRIAITTFLLMATFGTWAAWHPVGRIPDPPHAWVAWATVVMATTVCIHGNSYAAFLIGTNSIALQKRWEAMVSAVSLAAQGITILAGLGLLGLVLTAQAGLILHIGRASGRERWWQYGKIRWVAV